MAHDERDTNVAASEAPAAPTAPAKTRIGVDSAQIAAAKLQIKLDRRLGRTTPEIVKMIAAVK